MLALPTTAALLFLIPAIPISIWVAFRDVSTMKIPNKAVLALFAAYAVLGLVALPLDVYLWNYLHLVVMLVIGILLNMTGWLGAGDAKFMAAVAPMVAAGDISAMMLMLSACMIIGIILHRLLRLTPLRARYPHWESWTSGNRFPMGLPLAMALTLYLGLAAFGG
ncbi:prepilin peptidase [Loktanella sp. TSTF-M6]|uniref:Prepilin peptidase n=1 Tax=Loktanella gaetbuli TaxID=2881335 RepID=A0ABS8BWJ1_9RHOB|nr:prepilin peptidase [Loktanella gaetbuli]MCB5200108.1 prepilin peptidase [Loktanella gaetbuli]